MIGFFQEVIPTKIQLVESHGNPPFVRVFVDKTFRRRQDGELIATTKRECYLIEQGPNGVCVSELLSDGTKIPVNRTTRKLIGQVLHATSRNRRLPLATQPV
jgi:hypothetical protein